MPTWRMSGLDILGKSNSAPIPYAPFSTIQQVWGKTVSAGLLIKCPSCEKIIDSYDSYSDTKADMRDHYAVMHPGEKDPHG